MPPAQRRFAQVRVAAEVTPPPPAAPPRTTPMPAAGTNAASPFRRTDTGKRPRDEFALTSDDSEQGSPQGPRDECSPPGAAEPKVSEPSIEGRTPVPLDGQGATADGPATPVIECPPGYTPQRRQMQQWQGLANGVSSTVSPTTQGTRDRASARPTPVSRASARPTPPPVGLPVASPVRNKRHARLLPPALRNTTFASVQVVASPATPHPSQPSQPSQRSPKGRPAAPEPPAQASPPGSYPQPAAVIGAVLEPQAAGAAAQPATAGSPPSSSSDDPAADPDAQPGLDSRSASPPLGVACPEASRSVGSPLPVVASDDEASGATSSRAASADSQASGSASGGPSSRASASRASASRAASGSAGSSDGRSRASSGSRVSSLSRGSRCSAATGSASDDASTHNSESRSSSRTGDQEDDAARGTCEPEASAGAVSLRTATPPADHRSEGGDETSRASSAPSDDSSSGASQPPGSSSRSCSDAGVAGAPSADNTAQSVIMASELASELAAARHFSWAGGSDEGAQLGVPALESPGRSAVAPPILHSIPLLPSPHRGGRMSAPADPAGHEGHDENDILYSSDERSDDASQAGLDEGGIPSMEGEEEEEEGEETGNPAEDVHRHGGDAGRPPAEAGPRMQRWVPSEPLIGLSQLDPEASMSMGSRSHHPRDRSLLEGGRGAPRVFLSQADGSNSLPLSIGGGDGTFGSIPAPPPEHHRGLEQQQHAIDLPTPQPGVAKAVMAPADRLQVARGLDLGDEMPMVAATPAERVSSVVRHWTVEVLLQDLRGRTARRAVFRAAEGDTIGNLHGDVANAFRLRGPLCFYVLHAGGTVTPLSRTESLAVRSRVWCHEALDHGIMARGLRDERFAPPPPQPVQHLMVYPAGLRRALPPVIAATVTDAVSGVAVSDEHARDLMDRSPVVLHAPLAVALDGTGLPASSGMKLTACDTGVTAPLPAPVAVLHGGAPPGSHVRWYRGRAVERAAVAATGGSRNAFDKRHVVCVVEQCRVQAGFAVADVREVGTIIVHYDVWALDLVRIN